jgi:hypothetical protein
MEGAPRAVVPTDLCGVDPQGWEVALVTPGLDAVTGLSPGTSLTLRDSEGVVFVRRSS